MPKPTPSQLTVRANSLKKNLSNKSRQGAPCSQAPEKITREGYFNATSPTNSIATTEIAASSRASTPLRLPRSSSITSDISTPKQKNIPQFVTTKEDKQATIVETDKTTWFTIMCEAIGTFLVWICSFFRIERHPNGDIVGNVKHYDPTAGANTT